MFQTSFTDLSFSSSSFSAKERDPSDSAAISNACSFCIEYLVIKAIEDGKIELTNANRNMFGEPKVNPDTKKLIEETSKIKKYLTKAIQLEFLEHNKEQEGILASRRYQLKTLN